MNLPAASCRELQVKEKTKKMKTGFNLTDSNRQNVFAAVMAVLVILLPCTGISVAARDTEFMTVDKLKPGMKGTGKTVFLGTEISEFGVEILGVLKNIYPDGDMILARLDNELLDRTGLIAGMSGSPVYIDGKLIGAVAYGWGFTKETIAGITPIEEMLAVLDSDADIKPFAWGEKQFKYKIKEPISIGRYKYGEILINPKDSPVSSSYSPSTIVLNSIATPVMVSGFAPEILRKLEPTFRNFGLMPVQSGAGTDRIRRRLLPGAVVGVQLLSGDCQLSALGTVTLCRDGKVLAFGHPFLASGKVDFPMTCGSILSIVPSQFISFKLGSSGPAVGRITRDTRTAISGEVGKFARLIPVHIRVKTDDGKKEFDYRMVHDDFWAPSLLNWCLMNSAADAGGMGEKSASVNMRIRLADIREPVSFENIFSMPLPVSETVLHAFLGSLSWQQKLSDSLKQLMENPFRKVCVENINVEVEISDKPVTASIERIRVDKNEAAPGEDLKLSIILKPYESDYVTLRTSIRIPGDLPEGKITIYVCDAGSSLQMTRAVSPEKNKPHSFEQLIDIMQEVGKNNEIMVKVFLPRSGVLIHGEELPSLPGSLVDIMASSKETGIGHLAGEICRRIQTQWVITGCHQLEVMVKKEFK